MFKQKQEKNRRLYLNDNVEVQSSFESILWQMSVQFINMPPEEFDNRILLAQKSLCDFFNLDRSVVWVFNENEPSEVIKTHWYDPKNTLSTEKYPETYPISWLFDQVYKKNTVAISSLNDLPEEAFDDLKSIKDAGVNAMVAVPLLINGKVFGALSFCSFKKRKWPEKEIGRFRFCSQVIANAFAFVRKESENRKRLEFESLLLEISARFVSLPAAEIENHIELAQKAICECLDIDLSALWQWSDTSPHFLTITHLYSPPEGPEHPLGIDASQAFPWVLRKALQGEIQTLYTEKMPIEAAIDKESRREFGIKSSLVIPLCAGDNTIIGIISFDHLHHEKIWSEQIIDRLTLIAQVFSNALVRQRNEFKLKENEERLRLATGAAGIGIWIMDLSSMFVWGTQKIRDIFQFDPDERLNRDSFFKKVHPEDIQKLDETVQQAIQSGGGFQIEYRLLFPDRSAKWISSSGKVFFDSAGKPVRLMGVSSDFSQRKQMEIRLSEQIKEISQLKLNLEAENIDLRKRVEINFLHKEIIARSPEMLKILDQVEQVAQTDASVLIEGETGTGKELIARMVHRLSLRKDRPLISINCASLPPTLVESELFGREKGAYTGALTKMTGRFEVADDATLFLDEIGELPLEIQAKLLRVLEQGSFERLGSTKTIQVDVRIIAATNQNLEKLVAEAKFRKDLYYRLNIFPIFIPPLRERIDDIPPLTWAFVREIEKKMGKRIDHISRRSMGKLQEYNWPGNIRELRNLLERSLIVSKGRTLEINAPAQTIDENHDNLTLEEMERKHIISVLEKTSWRISGKGSAASILGLKRTTLQSRMKKLGIQRP